MTPIINQYKMNIPNKFELYFENKLSKSEKINFERELLEHAELFESYKAYFQINRMLESELYSPVLNYNNDPVLKELNISQRLAIEEDYIRFHIKESDDPCDNTLIPNPEQLLVQTNSQPSSISNNNSESERDEEKFRELLNHAGENKSIGRHKVNRLYFGIAAAIVISFFAGKIIFGLNLSDPKKISPQKAYLAYYSPRTDNELKSLDLDDRRLNKIFLDFKRSNLSSSAIFSNQMKFSEEDYQLSLLFLGIINLERNDAGEARKCFNRILTFQNPVKYHTAVFYLSLTYLSEGNFAEANPLLVKLSETKNPYHKKAKAIIRSVKLY